MNTAIFVACLLGWQSWDTPTGMVSICSNKEDVRVRVISKKTRLEFSTTAIVKRGDIHLAGRSMVSLDVGKCRVVMPSFFAILPTVKMRVPFAAAAGVKACRTAGGTTASIWMIDLSGVWVRR